MDDLTFPELDDTQVVFNEYPRDWFRETLAKANEAGMNGYSSNNWEKRFSDLFFNGGKLYIDKSKDDDYTRKGLRMLKSIIGSFEPKHEHKTAVCAYILMHIEGEK